MRQSRLLIIFLIVFIDLVSFGITIPVLPYFSQAYGASAWQLGWLIAVYAALQFLLAPFWGRVSDYVGRRPVLLLGLLGSVISLAVLGLAGSLEWLFIGRAIAGACGSNIPMAYAHITDVTSEPDREKGMGMIGAAFGLSFVFGPAIGGILARYGFSFPMFAGAALALFNLAFAFFKFDEPRLATDARSSNRAHPFDGEVLRSTYRDRRARLATGIFFLVTFAIALLESVFAIYMGARYRFDAEGAGFLIAVMGLVMISVRGGLITRLDARYDETKLIIGGAALCALSLAGFASVNSLALIVILLSGVAFGHGVLHPSLSVFASIGTRGASAAKRGFTVGVLQSAGGFARILGPPCAGWLYDRVSWRSPFYFGSILFGLAFLIAAIWMNAARAPVTDPYLSPYPEG
jgi:DHA1 family tetracycline resistance protein-like MFS transporter